MKLNELIEKYKRYEGKWNSKTGELARQIFLEDLKQLDEPQPVKVKQFVADWIEYFKKCSGTLYGSTVPFSYYGRAIADDFDYNVWECVFNDGKGKETEMSEWICKTENAIQTLVNMHQFAYEVEEEKRYLVKIKASGQYIMNNPDENAVFFYSSRAYSKLTRKELEEAGYGWVFDCEGIEIEEVE